MNKKKTHTLDPRRFIQGQAILGRPSTPGRAQLRARMDKLERALA